MKKLRIIITGARGQLGQSLLALAPDFPELELIATDLPELDITGQGALETFLSMRPSTLPTTLINCAAYTAVDKAETDEDAAYSLNSFAPAYLAISCSQLDMMMIHISTDYVFAGDADTPYLEDHPKAPLSVYGETKAVGEENVQRFLGLRSLIVRTAWLYSPYGQNFVKTMLRLSHERDRLRVVDDQLGAPTYAPHLAEALLRIALLGEQQGYFQTPIVHYTNEGSCSWHELATEAIRLMGNPNCAVQAISTEEYGATAARRPHYSVLSHRYLEKYFDIHPPHWRDGLQDFAQYLSLNQTT